MKKLISILMIAALVATVLAVSVFATGEAVITTTTDVTAVNAGDEFTVSFNISNNPGFASAKFKVIYDAEVLELTALANGLAATANNPATALVNHFSAVNVTDDGVLFTATFKVLEGAKGGYTDIGVEVMKLNNASLEAVAYSATGTQVMINCSEHSWDEGVYTNPTCTEDGYTTYTCTACGETKVVVDEGTAGHTAAEAVKENEVPATCTEDGSYDLVVYCSVCGEEISREKVIIEAEGHSWDEGVYTEPTCTEDGYTTYTCTECGETKVVVDEGSAKGHSWEDGVCTECGAEDPNAPTGDFAIASVVFAMMMSVVGLVVIRKKH